MKYNVLHVGCGNPHPNKLPAYFSQWQELRLDADPACQPDVVASMVSMPLSSNHFDGIFCAHTLEHLPKHEITPALQECRRVLKPEGVLYLRVPDLQVAAEFILNDLTEDVAYISPFGPITPLDIVYGYGQLIAINPYMRHQTGFTLKTLAYALMKADFAQVTATRHDFDIHALALCELHSEEQIRNLRTALFPLPKLEVDNEIQTASGKNK